MTQIVFIWFPKLTLERWKRVITQYRTLPGTDVPVVLSRDGPHGPVVHAIDDTAAGRGIQPGARVVDVQAIHPDLHVETADLQGDGALMDHLTHWSRRWCPWTVRDGSDGLALDVTGTPHLFGGDDALLRDMVRRFAMQGLTARVAMAPTRGAAQAIARYGTPGVWGEQTVMDALAELPVAALGLKDDAIRLLNRLGLKTIGALMDVPRKALMRRFANHHADHNPLVLLDRAVGRTPDPLNAPADHIRYIVRSRLPEPVIDPVPHLAGLAETLCHELARAEQGARQLQLTIYRIDGEWRSVQLGTARPSREPLHITRLFDGKLDSIDPGFGFDLLTLEALRVEPVPLIQDQLDGKRDGDADVAGLLDRLTARLGPDKVTWNTWSESYIPERMESRLSALHHMPEAAPVITRDRPLRLLDPAEEVAVLYAVPEGPPSQFRWRRIVFRTVRYGGPERIAPEWWKDRPGTRLRDYYKVEVQDGRRFWLYREGVIYDGRGAEPRWFLHGFFA